MELKQRERDAGAAREGGEHRPAPLVPAVDIVEDKEGITVVADMPGVPRENLSIAVDGDTLTVEGTVNLGDLAKLHAVYAEVRVAQYRRSFVLSRDLDRDGIDASLSNGVLRLRIPKREQARPRRIEVRSG